MLSAERNNSPSIAPQRRRSIARLACLIFIGVAATVFMRDRQVAAGPDNNVRQNTYGTEIAKTYDFKFCPNPFSPGKATTTTGTFIPGEKFIPPKRCGTFHTKTHAQT